MNQFDSICSGCAYIKTRCICDDHPLIQEAKRKLYRIEDFIKYTNMLSRKKEPSKMTIEFTHERFRNNKSNVYLTLGGWEMQEITSKAIREAERQRDKLKERIRKLNEEESRIDTESN